jgi:S-sulfo-L-cysteine synthase (O-acetyl-L-serine-dependent)
VKKLDRLEIAGSVLELTGGTPLVQLRRVTDGLRPGVEVHAKLEYLNPGGSVKDRAGLRLLLDGIEKGTLTKGRRVIDATSGNTGIALAMAGAALGYPVTLVMPENVTPQRRKIVAALGAEVVFSDPMEGSDGAIRRCDEIVAADPSKWYRPDQYKNEANPQAHYRTTGPEVWEQTGGRITHFVAGIGTTGTLIGTARFLRTQPRKVRCVAAEPAEALHGLEGLKHMATAIVPAIWKPEEIDEIVPVATESGWDMAERLAREEGIPASHSGGAAVWVALEVAKKLDEGVVVTVLPDSFERYPL